MIKESFVSTLEAEDRRTAARVRDLLAPDADDDTIAAYAIQHDWVILTADGDYLSDDEVERLRRPAASRRDDLIVQLEAFVALRAFGMPRIKPKHIGRAGNGDHFCDGESHIKATERRRLSRPR